MEDFGTDLHAEYSQIYIFESETNAPPKLLRNCGPRTNSSSESQCHELRGPLTHWGEALRPRDTVHLQPNRPTNDTCGNPERLARVVLETEQE
jgi:hypothetical protein